MPASPPRCRAPLRVLLAAGASGAASAAVNLTVTIRYPDARLGGSTLYVRGSGCGWSWATGVAAQRTAADTHVVAARCDGTSVELKALADDSQWMVGANAAVRFGAGSAAAVTVYPWFVTGEGTVQVISGVASPQGLRSRDVAVYLPPSYTENTLKPYHNLVVAHDGNNLFDGNSCSGCCPFGCWGLDTVLDRLIGASDPGLLAEVVVVAPYNTPDRMDEYTYSSDPEYGGGQLDKYLTFLNATLLPLVAQRYPRVVAAQKGPWAMLGSSLGGLASCYAGWAAGGAWAPSVCMSSSFWWDGRDFESTILKRAAPGAPSAHKMYIDWGSAESSDQVQSNEGVVQKLGSLGWDGSALHSYTQPGGEHNEASWGSRVDRPLQWLFPPEVVDV